MAERRRTRVVSMVTHDPIRKSSVFGGTAPRRRFQRQLSHSRVGMVGPSPYQATIRSPSPTPQRRAQQSLQKALENEDVVVLWRYYMDFDEKCKPLTNLELAKAGRKLTSLLVKSLKVAMASEDEEQLQEAVRMADGKLQILKRGGMKTLREAKEQLGMDPDGLPEACAITPPLPSSPSSQSTAVTKTTAPSSDEEEEAADEQEDDDEDEEEVGEDDEDEEEVGEDDEDEEEDVGEEVGEEEAGDDVGEEFDEESY